MTNQQIDSVFPQGGESCSCGGDTPRAAKEPPTFVYALGRVETRFPSQSIEKELAQAGARIDGAGLTDRQTLHAVLSRPEGRYLARQLCWTLTIEGMTTYVLVPRDASDLDLLISAVRPSPRPTDVDVVIGQRGPLAPPELCNGLVAPMVAIDQMYSFDVDTLLKALPRPTGVAEEQFAAAAEEQLYRIMQMADNAGATDEHRALNYLAVRCPAIYAVTAERHERNFTVSSVDVRRSRLSGVRKVVDVILSYTHRESDVVEKSFVRVDVTEEFPFLVSKLQPYFDR